MELFIKMTGEEKKIIYDALRVYSDYLTKMLADHPKAEGKTYVTEVIAKARDQADAMYNEFVKL